MKIERNRLVRVTDEDIINGHFTVPDNIKEVWHYAFGGCTTLRSITIPSSVEMFGDEVFYNCPLLKEIDVSALRHVSSTSFYKCHSIERIKLPNGNTYECTFFKHLMFMIDKKVEIEEVLLLKGFYFNGIIHDPNGFQFLYRNNGFIVKKNGAVASADTEEEALRLLEDEIIRTQLKKSPLSKEDEISMRQIQALLRYDDYYMRNWMGRYNIRVNTISVGDLMKILYEKRSPRDIYHFDIDAINEVVKRNW